MSFCWKCGKSLLDLPPRLAFRELCPHCSAYLHSCKNCTYYKPGLSNDCQIPGTDLVKDRESFNFCEEFHPLGKAPEERKNPQDVLKRLFGDD